MSLRAEIAATTLRQLPGMVRHRRQREGLSHRALGAAVGLSYADLCRFEKGAHKFDLPNTLKLLDWLAETDDSETT